MDDNAAGATGSVPSPGEIRDPADADTGTAGAATMEQTPDTGNVTKTADEREALKVAAAAGADTPPVSQDKVAKGIQPSDDNARRIDEMTNDEAKAYSRDFANGDIHRGDESRPAGKSDLLATNSERRTDDAEKNYREHYSKGWNDHLNGDNRIDEYRGGAASPEDKSAYLAGYHGAEREAEIGHAGGDMKRGEFEKARVSGLTDSMKV